MLLSDISIKRPVLASMMSLALVVFGFVGLQRLPVRELPNIDPPIVNVTTVYPGANAQVVETEVTERLEEQVNGIEGIEKVTSESREQVSNITIEFDLSRDIDVAAQDVRDRVSRVRGSLPEEVEEPIVAKQEADARPVMWAVLNSERHSTLELTDIAENQLQERLQTVQGVSSVVIGGSKRFAMRLWLDSEKMAAHQVTVLDVEQALKENNVELPSGRVENWQRELTIQTRGELKTPEEFNRMIIRTKGDTLVRLEDIGEARVGVEDLRTVARSNGLPAVGLGIVRQSTANTIAVAEGIREELDRLKPTLPAGININIPYDESRYIGQAVEEVWWTLGIAFILVIGTIFVFLRNPRSTIIPTVAVPVSIIGAFLFLYIMDYSVNILTMMALVLAIGIVVDDSIVVLENIYRHIEDGMSPAQAAFRGMGEISFAIITITISLVAVFMPLAFQTSTTGRLFVEFALAMCGAVIISAFVALTLSPTMAAGILKPAHEQRHGAVFNAFERGFNALSKGYGNLLRWSLRHRLLLSSVAVGAIALMGFFYVRLESSFLPEEDKGRLINIVDAPEGSTSEYTDGVMREMESIVEEIPEVENFFSAVALSRSGPGEANSGLMFMSLKDKRDRRVQDIVNGPNGLSARFFSDLEGAMAFPIIPKAIGRSFSQQFQVVLQHQDLDRLNDYTSQLVNKLRGLDFLSNVRTEFQVNKPEVRVRIERDRAATLGVSVQDISRTLQILFGGVDLSRIKRQGKEYDVIVQLQRQARLTPKDLEKIYVRSRQSGGLVQLNNVIHYQEGAAPTAIFHHNRSRSATVQASLVDVPLGTAMEKVAGMLKEDLPPGFRYTWSGEAEDLKESGNEVLFVLLLAIVLVYMVLASQFESLVHPFTVMLALPLAGLGALGALWLLNWVDHWGEIFYAWANYSSDPPVYAHWLSTLVPRIPAMNINLFSQVGMVLLVGLVTKNSILLVEFANQWRAKGHDAHEAMIQAGLVRLRPILMTSTATIAAILPIAFGMGAGGASRRPMGVAVVGGMITSTFLTLFVIPVVYTLFSDAAAKLNRLTGRKTETS